MNICASISILDPIDLFYPNVGGWASPLGLSAYDYARTGLFFTLIRKNASSFGAKNNLEHIDKIIAYKILVYADFLFKYKIRM